MKLLTLPKSPWNSRSFRAPKTSGVPLARPWVPRRVSLCSHQGWTCLGEEEMEENTLRGGVFVGTMQKWNRFFCIPYNWQWVYPWKRRLKGPQPAFFRSYGSFTECISIFQMILLKYPLAFSLGPAQKTHNSQSPRPNNALLGWSGCRQKISNPLRDQRRNETPKRPGLECVGTGHCFTMHWSFTSFLPVF